jgi:hypothetical protein
MMEKYEMCMMNVRTYTEYAKQQKANGSQGWKQSLETAKAMLAMAAEIKRELDADKTAEYMMAA